MESAKHEKTSLKSTTRLILFTLLTILLFCPMFVLHGLGGFDFWWWMSSNLVVLISLAMFIDPTYRAYLREDFSSLFGKKLLIGLFSAVILYVFFYAGNVLSRLMFDFAGDGIAHVYAFKGDAEGIRIGLLMLLIIGPGEELLWRGFLQRHFQDRMGRWKGYILATAVYTGVHVLTGNLMLIVAALVAGLFWGWLFMRHHSMVINIVSHTIWDISVFLLFPFH